MYLISWMITGATEFKICKRRRKYPDSIHNSWDTSVLVQSRNAMNHHKMAVVLLFRVIRAIPFQVLTWQTEHVMRIWTNFTPKTDYRKKIRPKTGDGFRKIIAKIRRLFSPHPYGQHNNPESGCANFMEIFRCETEINSYNWWWWRQRWRTW